MNFSALSSSEKVAAYASVVVFILGIVSLVNKWGGLMVLPVLGAAGMFVVLFAPSMMPNTKLPGSKGSLMLLTGAVAGIFWVIVSLQWLEWIFGHLATFDTLLFLVGLAGALYMAWAGWQAFTAEGGKLKLGSG